MTAAVFSDIRGFGLGFGIEGCGLGHKGRGLGIHLEGRGLDNLTALTINLTSIARQKLSRWRSKVAKNFNKSIYSCRIKIAIMVSDCITSYDARTPFAVKFRHRLCAWLTIRFNEMQCPYLAGRLAHLADIMPLNFSKKKS